MVKQNKSILLVDDDVGILTACAESLMIDGYQVDVAESGEKALEMIGKKKYHLIITDLMMGEVDGLQVLRYAKEFSPFSEVVMLTAHGSVDSAVDAMKMGAYDYLPKPFDPYKLDTAVRRALEHQTLLREISGLREILRLYEATKTLSGIRGERELLDTVVKYAAEISDADGCVLLIPAADVKQMTVAAVHGVRHGVLQNRQTPYQRDLVDRLAVEDLKTLDGTDVRKYVFFEDAPGYAEISASFAIPISYKGRVVAVMGLCRLGPERAAFGDEELRLITIFSAQVGYALENLRLFDTIQAESHQDAFARLFNACQAMAASAAFKSLPLNEKMRFEEVMDQCRLLLERSLESAVPNAAPPPR
jgi:FixJ family two-component response regulator